MVRRFIWYAILVVVVWGAIVSAMEHEVRLTPCGVVVVWPEDLEAQPLEFGKMVDRFPPHVEKKIIQLGDTNMSAIALTHIIFARGKAVHTLLGYLESNPAYAATIRGIVLEAAPEIKQKQLLSLPQVPILLVDTVDETTVGRMMSFKNQLLNNKHSVYIFLLGKGLMVAQSDDVNNAYKALLQAFYHHCNFPYNKDMLYDGQQLLQAAAGKGYTVVEKKKVPLACCIAGGVLYFASGAWI